MKPTKSKPKAPSRQIVTRQMGSIRRGKITRYIETPHLIVALEVPVIFVPEQPDEPLLEAATLKLLDEAQARAEAGDRKWLRKIGRLFERAVA